MAEKVNIINGRVVPQFMGKPMQDAKPAKPEDNEVYALEKSIVTHTKVNEEVLEKQPEPMGGGVSSWNDLTDKPFDETFEGVTILPVTTVTYKNYSSKMWLGQLSHPLEENLYFDKDKQYMVVLNGVYYPAEINGTNYLDVDGVFPEVVNTNGELGHLFRLSYKGSVTVYDMPNDPSFTFEMQVVNGSLTVHTIDPKYIPDEIARTSDIGNVVKSVNGITPDNNGNVVVESSNGGSGWNDVTDKPFGASAGKLSLAWDGVIGDRETMKVGTFTYCKQSSLVPNYESITNASVKRSNGLSMGGERTEYDGGYGIGSGDVIVITRAGDVTVKGTKTVAPSTGIYFSWWSDGAYYCKTAEISCDIPDTTLYLNSASGDRYAITVSNDGTLNATKL